MKFTIRQPLSATELIEFEGQFASGDRVALIGSSGAGKTTLLRYLAGLNRAGQVHIESPSGTNLSPSKSDAVYLHQSPVMFAHHSVNQTIEFARRFGRRSDLPLSSWAEQLELTPLLDKRCTELSGGQQQRVALLRALASGKPWLLLDEAFSALDPVRLIRACEVLADYCALTGAGLILASHQQAPQRFLCNRAFVVDQLSGSGTDDLFTALNRSSGGHIATTLMVTAQSMEHGFLCCDCAGESLYLREPELWQPGEARVSIAAEDISIAVSQDHLTSMVNRLSATLTSMSSEPGPVQLTLDVGGQPLTVQISAFSAHRLDLKPGQTVFAEFKVGAVEWHGQVQQRIHVAV